MKNFQFLLLFFAGLMLTGSQGCYIDLDDDDDDFFGCTRGQGNVERQVLDLDDFHSIVLTTSSQVILSQGSAQLVEVEGQDNIIDLLDRRIRNGVWEIEFDDCVRSHENLRIYITLPEIKGLTITGSGDIIGENEFLSNDMDLVITGSGDMDLALDADDLDVRMTGSGDMFLEGVCDRLDITSTGSGDFSGFGLESRSADVTVTGSGDVEVLTTDHLDVRITGSGDVSYRGNPTIDVTITGSGRLINAN